MENKEILVTFRVDKALKEEFFKACDDECLTVSKVFRRFMIHYVTERRTDRMVSEEEDRLLKAGDGVFVGGDFTDRPAVYQTRQTTLKRLRKKGGSLDESDKRGKKKKGDPAKKDA